MELFINTSSTISIYEFKTSITNELVNIDEKEDTLNVNLVDIIFKLVLNSNIESIIQLCLIDFQLLFKSYKKSIHLIVTNHPSWQLYFLKLINCKVFVELLLIGN